MFLRGHVSPLRRFAADPLLTACAVLALPYLALGLFSDYWLRVLTPYPVTDDFRIYYDAWRTAATSHDPYQPYVVGESFLYHPAALALIGIIARPFDFAWARACWSVLSILAYAASLGVVWRLARAQRAAGGGGGVSGRLALFLVGALCFAPFWETVRIGQINCYVGLWLYLSLLWSAERPRSAGLVLALAIACKLSPIVFVLYFPLVSRERTSIAALAWLASLTALAALAFSPIIVSSYLAILPRLTNEIHATVYNQSSLGVLVRWLDHVGHYELVAPAAFLHRLVFLLVTALLLLTVRMRPRHALSPAARLHLFSALVVAMVVFSPLVWQHHSVLLLLPIAVLLFHPSRAYAALAVTVLLLLQANRAFEHFVLQAPLPAVLAHAVLLTATVTAYLQIRLVEIGWGASQGPIAVRPLIRGA